ncbi:MAG: nucleotidyltransferase family protein [Clostridia bacterium]|nr:nucleotidyltransferase family protein [Clostridia bacterium]
MRAVTREALLILVKKALFGGEEALPEGVDWTELYEESKKQAVTSLCALSVPAEKKPLFLEAALRNKARFMQALFEQDRLIALLRGSDIPLVILKGSAAAAYYPVPAARTVGDVDLLVKPADYEAARALLRENGYVSGHENERHTEYEKNTVDIELHRQYSFLEADLEPLLFHVFDTPEPMRVMQYEFPAFPAPENGLVLLDHMRHHFTTGGLGLRHLADWAMFVHREMTPAFWENRFLPLAEQAGMTLFAQVMTRAAELYIGLPGEHPWARASRDDLPARVMDFFFVEGNFGVKKDKTALDMEKAAVVLYGKGFFKGLQSAGKRGWALYHHFPFLLPFAWLRQAFVWGFLALRVALTGKGLREAVRTGKTKAALYRDLGVL